LIIANLVFGLSSRLICEPIRAIGARWRIGAAWRAQAFHAGNGLDQGIPMKAATSSCHLRKTQFYRVQCLCAYFR
jgi:hypothetical protein